MEILKRADHLAWRNLGEHTIVIDSRISKEVHHFNEVGSFLWDLLDGTNSKHRIHEQLLSEYDIDEETAKEDLNKFLFELKSKGLLK